MKRTWLVTVLISALGAVGVLRADDKKPAKLDWTAKKGDAALFTVKRSSSSEGGQFSTKEETEIQYRIEVADRKDNGDLELKVSYAKAKSKQEGRDSTWEFDSAEKDGGDEAAAFLRGVVSKAITVKLSGGKIADVAGFPELERPEQGGGGEGFRLFRRKGLLSRRSLEGDLDLILARAVRGQDLESGKEYRLAREEPAGGEGEGRRRFGGLFGRGGSPRVLFKYQGEDKAGDQVAAKFALSAEPPQRPEGDGPRAEVKSEGAAAVSMKDGLLLKLEVSTKSKFEGERDGQSFSFSTSSKTVILRETPSKKEAASV